MYVVGFKLEAEGLSAVRVTWGGGTPWISGNLPDSDLSRLLRSTCNVNLASEQWPSHNSSNSVRHGLAKSETRWNLRYVLNTQMTHVVDWLAHPGIPIPCFQPDSSKWLTRKTDGILKVTAHWTMNLFLYQTSGQHWRGWAVFLRTLYLFFSLWHIHKCHHNPAPFLAGDGAAQKNTGINTRNAATQPIARRLHVSPRSHLIN